MYRMTYINICLIILYSINAHAQNSHEIGDTLLVNLDVEKDYYIKIEKIRKSIIRVYTDSTIKRYERIEHYLDTTNTMTTLTNVPYNEYLCNYKEQFILNEENFKLYKKNKNILNYLQYDNKNINDWKIVVYFYFYNDTEKKYSLVQCKKVLYD